MFVRFGSSCTNGMFTSSQAPRTSYTTNRYRYVFPYCFNVQDSKCILIFIVKNMLRQFAILYIDNIWDIVGLELSLLHYRPPVPNDVAVCAVTTYKSTLPVVCTSSLREWSV